MSDAEKANKFLDWKFWNWLLEEGPWWRVPLVVVAFAVVVASIIAIPAYLTISAEYNDQSARCEAHGWSLKTVRNGAFCVREDGVIVEIPER